MVGSVKEVRGLLIPLDGIRLVLPDSIILQVLTAARLVKYDNAPNWLLGSVEWQKRIIPTLSFEQATGARGGAGMVGSRLLVLKSINNIEKMPFYALVLAGIPHPAILGKDNVSEVEHAALSSPLILNQVLVDGEPASIPNLDAVEEMLMSQYGLFGQTEN